MSDIIYVSHGVVFVYDRAEKEPCSDWTQAHVDQGFARRARTATISTLAEDARAQVRRVLRGDAQHSDEAIEFSLLTETGLVAIGGIDAADAVIWQGAPGWVRVNLGQHMDQDTDGDERDLELTVWVERDSQERPTIVRRGGTWLAGPFIETATPARY
jgi:hypothetical protein